MDPVTTYRFRPGRAEDLPVVQEISQDIWGGNDYMPFVWLERMEEPELLTWVLEADGQMVAFYQLKLVRGEKINAGWWQSVRVNSKNQGQGLGKRMLEHALGECERLGLSRLRFGTGEPNTTMHRLAQIYNFRFIAPYSMLNGPLIPQAEKAQLQQGVRVLEPDEFETARRFIQSAPSWERGEGFYCDSWVWKDLDNLILKRALESGEVYGYFEGDNLLALALGKKETWGNENFIFVGWLDGTPHETLELCRYLQVEASRRAVLTQKNVLDLMVVRDEGRDHSLQELGFNLDPHDYMRLYERIL